MATDEYERKRERTKQLRKPDRGESAERKLVVE
jgi:hypothetical protein